MEWSGVDWIGLDWTGKIQWITLQSLHVCVRSTAAECPKIYRTVRDRRTVRNCEMLLDWIGLDWNCYWIGRVAAVLSVVES